MNLIKRKSIRLKKYDYSSNGMYFVTICTHERECLFGEIREGIMCLSIYGKIAYSEMLNTNKKRINDKISIEKFIIMPNHVHMIVNIQSYYTETIKTNKFSILNKKSLPTVIGGYKSAVTKNINMLIKTNSSVTDTASNGLPVVWQKRYYEHIIRNIDSYNKIWNYIDTNQLNWEKDRFYVKN